MGYIEQSILSGEEVLYRAKLHWIIFVWPAFFLLIALFGFAFSAEAGMSFLLIAVLWGIVSFIRYSTSEFGVTNKRIIIKVGVISRRTLEMNLAKVESVNVSQNIFGRILGYGNITVIGSGGTREHFHRISRPLDFRKAFQQLQQ